MYASDPDFAVLHVLRLRKIAPKEALDDAVGGDSADRLRALAGAGLVRELTGRMTGWTMTKEGRARHAKLLDADRAAGNLPTTLRPAYEQFLTVNQPFIDLCSDWQLRRDTGEPNEHDDPAYDEGILSELEEIDKTGGEVAAKIAEVGSRFASYGPRLQAALEKVRAGDREWFTKPTIDSYHTVWFELHEDLLVSQGIERAEGR